VILATDGDFNVGVSSDAEMVRLIEERREQGTFLTVLGFGTGNLKDSKPEPLRYQRTTDRPGAARGGELLFVRLRHQAPEGGGSRLIERAVPDRVADPSPDLSFAAAVAAFGMVLRDSPHGGTATLDDVLALAERGLANDRDGDRAELMELVRRARGMVASETAARE
jgi:Ca-activated chloride channel family protein